MSNIQTVILCGGKGLRLGADRKPKSLFSIGEKPILWHIMKIYAFYGFKDFILCLGYEGEKIRRYFKDIKNWHITFADTGIETNTGGRLVQIEKYIRNDCFFATYGDGLADINLSRLHKFHKRQGKIATITVVRPHLPFGIVDIDGRSSRVKDFKEKPLSGHWINGGFFVFNNKVFKYLNKADSLEKDTFTRLLKDREISACKHKGFWECMDTYKDNLRLNELWSKNRAPWALWKKR